MRFLFFTDTHIRGLTPRSRVDDFYSTVKNKFQEIAEMVEIHKIDFVLHGGDWFDRPDISPSIVRDFAMIIRDFKKPIYTVAGNHDIYGHNPETLSRTMLGLLEGTDTIKIIKQDQPIILEKSGTKVQLYGNSYSFDIDSEGYEKYYIVKKDPSVDFCINMVHGMLLPKPFIEGIKYTLIDDIVSTEADITLAGHYHTGFGIKKLHDKYFINPGSLIRISALKNEIIRMPETVIIDLEQNIKVWLEKLKTALPGDEVLDREHIERAEDRAYKLNQFFNNAQTSGEYKHERVDINKIIDEIAVSQGLADNVKIETIKRIEQARGSFSKEEVDS